MYMQSKGLHDIVHRTDLSILFILAKFGQRSYKAIVALIAMTFVCPDIGCRCIAAPPPPPQFQAPRPEFASQRPTQTTKPYRSSECHRSYMTAIMILTVPMRLITQMALFISCWIRVKHVSIRVSNKLVYRPYEEE